MKLFPKMNCSKLFRQTAHTLGHDTHSGKRVQKLVLYGTAVAYESRRHLANVIAIEKAFAN